MKKTRLQDVFRAREGVFDHYPEAERLAIASTNRTLGEILKRILSHYYSAQIQIMGFSVNEERFLFRLTHNFQSAAEPNDLNPSTDMIERFMRDFSKITNKKDIFIGQTENGYRLISFRPEELAAAMEEFVAPFEQAELYNRAITAALAQRTIPGNSQDLN